MPRYSERRRTVNHLVRQYLKYRQGQRKHHQRLKRRLRRALKRAGLHTTLVTDSDTTSSSSSAESPASSSSHPETTSSSESRHSEELHASTQESSSVSGSSEFEIDLSDLDIELEDSTSLESDDEEASHDSGDDADIEDELSSSAEEDDSDEEPFWTPGSKADRIARAVRAAVEARYASRYEVPRDSLPRGPSRLPHVLSVLKEERPDHFRQQLRVWPTTFDKVVSKIQNDPIFFNQSNNPQLPVETQLAITLYRFGHDGNAASLQDVANWAGVGKGTVLLCTRRTMTAVLRRSFMDTAVHLPTRAEKRKAKKWVKQHSCHAWRGGWCLVDGTLIPLYHRPYWYGQSYFDRKSNYSLNVQVNLMLVGRDYALIFHIDYITSEPTHHRLRLRIYRKHS